MRTDARRGSTPERHIRCIAYRIVIASALAMGGPLFAPRLIAQVSSIPVIATASPLANVTPGIGYSQALNATGGFPFSTVPNYLWGTCRRSPSSRL